MILRRSLKKTKDIAIMDIIPLQVEHLCKDFKQGGNAVRILNDLSFTVTKGDFVAVMGPSGSGKSTLLHVIGGLTDLTDGIVRIDGDSIADLGDANMTCLRRRKVGFVFQSFNLIPNLSVQDNITLPVQADGKPVDQVHLKELAERLGIADKLSRKPGNLSGGEQQRVAIARALLPNPAIILADEPTGSLDTTSGQSFCKLLSELCSEQECTIIMVTHEPAVAIHAKRTMILKDGRLIGEFDNNSCVTAHELAARYQDQLV